MKAISSTTHNWTEVYKTVTYVALNGKMNEKYLMSEKGFFMLAMAQFCNIQCRNL